MRLRPAETVNCDMGVLIAGHWHRPAPVICSLKTHAADITRIQGLWKEMED